MNKKQLIIILFITIITLTSIYAAGPIISKDISILPEEFEFNGEKYKVSADFNAESNTTIKYDFDGDGQIEVLVGFQARTNDEVRVPASFLILGNEAKGEFTPQFIIGGNDYFNRVELQDIDKDGL